MASRRTQVTSFGEEHVARSDTAAAAVVQVEDQVIFKDEVLDGVAEFAGGAVDGVAGTFEFDEGADRSFVELDEETLSPGVAGGKFVGGAEFFVTEPAAESEAFKDFLESRGVRENELDFFADFVVAFSGSGGRTDGQLVRGGFEGEQGARRRFLAGGDSDLGTDAEELTMLGEATIGGVEDEIEFMGARNGRLRAKLGETPKESFVVVDFELDFGFARHGRRLQEGARERKRCCGGQWGKAEEEHSLQHKWRRRKRCVRTERVRNRACW